MRSEWDKCYFCKNYDDFDGCQGWGCEFELSQDKVIEKAKEKDISCTDVLALIERRDDHDAHNPKGIHA